MPNAEPTVPDLSVRTRHKSAETLLKYICDEDSFVDHAGAAFLCIYPLRCPLLLVSPLLASPVDHATHTRRASLSLPAYHGDRQLLSAPGQTHDRAQHPAGLYRAHRSPGSDAFVWIFLMHASITPVWDGILILRQGASATANRAHDEGTVSESQKKTTAKTVPPIPHRLE